MITRKNEKTIYEVLNPHEETTEALRERVSLIISQERRYRQWCYFTSDIKDVEIELLQQPGVLLSVEISGFYNPEKWVKVTFTNKSLFL